MLKDGQKFPSVSKYTDPKINADGSVDIYFGPDMPNGQEKNWIKTVPGKGWFPIFRLYGPLEPLTIRLEAKRYRGAKVIFYFVRCSHRTKLSHVIRRLTLSRSNRPINRSSSCLDSVGPKSNSRLP